MERLKQNPLKTLVIAVVSLILGAIVMVAIRFIAFKPNTVHYHANFALYVNDVQDQFQGPGFYEEVQACTNGNSADPRTRVHMHNNINNVIHVHAAGATWGQFFANLGYTLGDKVLATDNGVYVDGQNGNHLSFILNGQPIDTIANRVINDDDVMLINYGNDSQATLNSHYKAIPHDAEKYDEGHDPASCAGSKPLTFGERLKIALGLNQ